MAHETSPDAETTALTAVDETPPGAPGTATDSSAVQTGVTLSKPKNFCRYGGMVGSKQSQCNSRTASLLHTRLRALGLLVVVVLTVGQLRDLLVDFGVGLGFTRVIYGLMVLFVGYLWYEKNPPLIKLRVFEVFVFLGPITMLVYLDRQLILQAATAGDAGLALMNWYRLNLHMAGIITAYAMFIPAGWKRTLIVTTPMGLAPYVLGALMINNQPAVAAMAQQALTAEIWSAALIMITAIVGIATYGTYIIDQARQQVTDIACAGQYHLEKKIGSGGMGEVWLARHRLLARPAAIKVIRPEMLKNGGGAADDARVSTAMKRFEREAQATASLTSPHTIDLYDFGTANDGSFYYVMQYLEGLDLDTLVGEHGPVPVERAVHLLIQACASLADAHEHDLIHRDIKPANIFATHMGITHDFVKVLDFGLVKETKADMAATQLTQQGMTSGTPAFMPPEIALAKPDVDARADIYALGCVGYWLTTGQYVFDSDSAMAMVVDHVKTEPAAPSTRTELPIPREFDDAILRALAKDPQARFQTMREFAEALRKVPVASAWTDARAEEWWALQSAGDEGGKAELH